MSSSSAGQVSPRPGRRGFWIVIITLGLAGLTALGWRVFQPSSEPVVAVPARVCDDAIEGSSVSSLFPRHGSSFKEETREFGSGSAGTGGSCFLYGGGMKIEINYLLHPSGAFTEASIGEMAKVVGRSPLVVGKAKGYVSDTDGVLFVSCPREGDSGSLVRIEAGYLQHSDDTQSSWRKEFRDLTVSAARYVAQDVLKCEGAESLGDDGNE